MSETPVLVGIAQLEQRAEDPVLAKEPLTLMIEAVQAAAADARAPELLKRTGSVRVVRGRWPYKDPARVIAEAVDAPHAETRMTRFGGNFVQSAVNQAALDIQSGRQEIILICGAECGNTQAKAQRAGLNLRTDLDWQAAPGNPDVMIGEDVPMAHEVEVALGVTQPIQVYPMFENALRHHLGETIDVHQRRIADPSQRAQDGSDFLPALFVAAVLA